MLQKYKLLLTMIIMVGILMFHSLARKQVRAARVYNNHHAYHNMRSELTARVILRRK